MNYSTINRQINSLLREVGEAKSIGDNESITTHIVGNTKYVRLDTKPSVYTCLSVSENNRQVYFWSNCDRRNVFIEGEWQKELQQLAMAL